MSYLNGPRLLSFAFPEIVNFILEAPDLGESDLDVLAFERVPTLGEGVECVSVGVELLCLDGVARVVEGVDEDSGQLMAQTVLAGEQLVELTGPPIEKKQDF